MDQQSELSELALAWRALSGPDRTAGWNSIQLNSNAPCQIRAGRHFPGNEEALLVGFRFVQVPSPDQLPRGRGFSVTRVDPPRDSDGRTWICLARQLPGNESMFEMMANDVLATLNARMCASEKHALDLFISRVRAWQNFMQRDTAILGAAEEIGLAGELVFAKQMLQAGLSAALVVESWKGPQDGPQDFAIGTGAIEVKTTIADGGFAAIITSLEQLDRSVVAPLCLAAVRLKLSTNGWNLAEQVQELRNLVASDQYALQSLNNLLIQAGYIDAVANQYVRRFSWNDTRILVVQDGFPRLTRSNVSAAILEARYKLDLDLVTGPDISLGAALASFGVM